MFGNFSHSLGQINFKSPSFYTMVVIMQLAKPVARVSVGEKACPNPLLSKGASVMNVSPDPRCSHEVLKLPVYVTLDVISNLLIPLS